MITFGLTGGIACGKSTATKTFIAEGIPMVDADVIARQVVEPGTSGLATIISTFGSEYLNLDGTMNRTAIAQLVFTDNGALEKMNKIMAPLINEESTIQIKKLHSQGHEIVGYDAALIIEMGNANKYRPLIVVSCPQHMQIERMMKRNGVTMQDAMARIKHQLPTEEKIKLADHVINTSGAIEESVAQTKAIINLFRRTYTL